MSILFLINPFISVLEIPLNTITKNNSLLGVYIAIILVMNLGFVLVSKKIIAILFYLTGATLQITALIQLGFSLPWIVASIGIIIVLSLFLFKLPKFADWKFILVLFVLIISLLSAIFGVLPFLKRQLPVEVSLGNGASWNVVTDIYVRSGKNLLLGTGSGTFPYDFALSRGREFNMVTLIQDVYFNSSYSTIYNIMSELGVIGLLVFLSFLAFGIGFIVILVKESSFWKKLIQGAPNLLHAITHIDRSLSIRRISDEFNETNDEQDRFYWEVIVVSCAWVTLTAAMFICYFEVSLWWLWWFLLLMFATGINLLALDVTLRKKIVSFSIQPPYSTAIYFASITILCSLAIGFVYGYNIYKAEIDYSRSMATDDAGKKEKLLVKAVDYRKNYAPYHLALSQVYMLKAASIARDDKTNNIELSQSLGQAISEAKTAAAIEPNSYKNWQNLATIYLNAAPIVDGASNWAIESFKKTIELSPSDYSSYVQLANSYILQNNYKDAEKNYISAINLKPDFLTTYSLLSDLYVKQEQYSKAIAIYEPIISKVTNDPDSSFKLGMLFFNRGGKDDYDKALLLFTRAVELRPIFSNAIFSLALVYEKKGDYKNALIYYRKVSELNPANKDLKLKIRSLENR